MSILRHYLHDLTFRVARYEMRFALKLKRFNLVLVLLIESREEKKNFKKKFSLRIKL